MPLYDYNCDNCGHAFEEFRKLYEVDDPAKCPECHGKAKKVIVLGHGGHRRNDAVWVRQAAAALADGPPGSGPKIETIEGLRQHLNDHPEIRPKESHPGLPSSLGDHKGSRDFAFERSQMVEKAALRIREGRAIRL